MFWYTQKRKVFTSLAIVQYNVKQKTVTDFSRPFLLSFEVTPEAASVIILHDGAAINKSDKERPDFEGYLLYRIDVYARQSFVVEFPNLPVDVTLSVLVESFYKPTFKEFIEKKWKIDASNDKLFISNNKFYDSWYYLAILPEATSESGPPPQYKFSVYTLGCYKWSEKDADWRFACGSQEDSSRSLITCKCYHSSTFVGMIHNNHIKLEESFIEELLLETQASYVILITVTVTFLLYCIFLSFICVIGVDEIREEIIYFLGDVPSFYRYGYVLIVKTGNKINATTTSNVMIKIYGTKSESKSHVLNYPDPEMQFLQKNEENWFFLATEFYLGDIVKIDLWCDYIGQSPSWFCAEVEIFDIQQHNYWLFEINQWLEIQINEQLFYTAYPTEISDTKRKKVIVCRFLKRIKNSFRGAHMWNIMSNEEQVITKMKRLHIIYSIFLTTYLMGIFLYGCPKLESSDSLAYSLHYKINKYVIFIAMGCQCVAFVMHFPIVLLFRNPKENILGKYNVMKEHPISTDSFCWFFLISNIVISMTLLIILGFWVPYVTGLLWLTSVGISLLVYISIVENIKRLIISLSVTQKKRVQQIFKYIQDHLYMVEKQRIMLYSMFGPIVLRPFFSHLYKPLNPLKIEYQKYWAALKSRLWEIVEDLVMISVYVVLLYLVILADRGRNIYLSHKVAEDLIQGTFARTEILKNVYHRKEMKDYINQTLIVSTQSIQWYGQYVWRNPGMTIDSSNKYLGVARLRQHRAHGIPCTAEFINQSVCYPTYFRYPEYGNFSEGWKPDEYSNRFSRMISVWNYVSAWDAGSEAYFGRFAIYPGGGYIATLGRMMQNSILNLNYLIRNNWFDHLTRCTFIEFLMYASNNNMFNAVRIKFEVYPTGYIHCSLNIHTAKLLFVKEETSIMLWIIFVSFLLVLTSFIIKLLRRVIVKKHLVLKDIWHLIDILIVLMSLTCLGLYVARSDVVKSFLVKLERAKNNEFVNYFYLMNTEKSLTIAAAILVFISTLRLWKLMRFMQIVRITERTLLLSSRPLLALFLYQIVFMFACTFYGHVRYGSTDFDFRSALAGVMVLFIASLNLYGDFNFDEISDTSGRIYYAVFMLVTLGIYTLYIAIITFCYAEAQFYYSNKKDYNIMHLIGDRYRFFREMFRIKWKNFRLRGGVDKNSSPQRKVFPKAEVFRYANCVTVPSNRMDAMNFVTRCVLRSEKKEREQVITDEDAELIKYTLAYLFNKEDTEEKEVFLMTSAEGEKMKLVDDEVLLKMERVAEELLVTDTVRLERQEHKEFCKKIVRSHEQKMKDMVDNLNVVVNALNKVNFE